MKNKAFCSKIRVVHLFRDRKREGKYNRQH